MPAWRVERVEGDAAALHASADGGSERLVRVCRVTAPALVLGSTQPEDHVDRPAAAAAGVAVVRRRSGGGAVLVEPDAQVWADAWLPAGDTLWHDDVGVAFQWLGDTWVRALAYLGVDAAPHRGPLIAALWSDRVCFAGLGPGEITVDGRKVVGLAQRRTRAGARFHCAALLNWRPERLGPLLDVPVDDIADIADGVALPADDVERAFVGALPG